MNLSSVFAALKPLIQPLAMEIINQLVIPEIEKLEAASASPELGIVKKNILDAVQNIVIQEVAQISGSSS